MRGIIATFITVVLNCVVADQGFTGRSSIQRKNGWDNFAQHKLLIRMPGVTPRSEDMYFCTSVKVEDYDQYIVQYEAMALKNTAHHMLLFGCEEPYRTQPFWPCGQTCKGAPKILYAWAKNAPATKLPKDVGFHIGGNSGVKHLVMQVHYKDAFPEGAFPDNNSGFTLWITRQKQKYIAGIYLMLAFNGEIKPHSRRTHVDVSCKYTGTAALYPFAYRVHAHALGEVISGYQYNGTFHLLGKGNPQWPQAFYPMDKRLRIKPGDYLVARCTYKAKDSTKTTHMGATHNDEMCNYYMMYYTDSSSGSAFYECGGNKYPALVKQLPTGSDTPLPPNPLLEDTAKGKAASGLGKIVTTGGSLYDPSSKYFAEPASVNNNYDYNYGLDYGGGGGGGGELNPEADRDYFYYEVQNQRSRNRHPFHKSQQDYHNVGQQIKGYGGQQQQPQGSAGYQGRGQQYNSWTDRQPFLGHPWQPQRPNQQRQPLYNNNRAYHRFPTYKSTYSATNSNPNQISSISDRISSNTYHKSKQMVDHTHTASGQIEMPLHGTQSGQQKSSSNVLVASVTQNKVDVYETLHKAEPDQTPVSSSLRVTENWPKDIVTLGQVSGVSTDAESNIHIFHRGSRVWDSGSFNMNNTFIHIKAGPIKEKTLVTFNTEGKIISQWGDRMFYMPHGLTVDGSGNIWLTDVAMHQVFKFKKGSPRPEMALGEMFVPGSDKAHFCKPTSVAVLTSGEVYVADGYCNHRVIKFSKVGKYLMEWGTRTSSVRSDGFPPPSAFVIPHSISVAEKKQRLYVADRENDRIQVFDLNGKFISQFHPVQFGRLFAVTYSTKNGFLYAVNGPNIEGAKKVQGFTLHPDSGKILDMWSPNNKGFSNPHDIAVSADGKCVFVAEIGPNKLWRFHVKSPEYPGTQLALHHPQTVDEERKKYNDKISDDAADFTASLIIGGLLIVPVLVVLVFAIFFRLRKSGKLRFFRGYNKNYKNRRMNLGNFFHRHNGFDRLNTEESDHEMDPLNSDEDIEEYSSTTQKA